MYYYDHFLIWTGWKVERGASCIHCTILPSHTQTVADQFINDLREAVITVKVSLTYVTYIYMWSQSQAFETIVESIGTVAVIVNVNS